MRFFAIVNDITGQGSLSQSEEFALEFLVITIIEKAKCTATTGGIVDNFSHHRTCFIKEQLVTNAYFTRRFNENVPQTHLLVQFSKQKHFDFCIRFFFRSIETCRENLCIIENKSITFAEIIKDIAEVEILSFNGITFRILLEHLYLSRPFV